MEVEDEWLAGRFVRGVDGGAHAVGLFEERGVDPMVLLVLRLLPGHCEGVRESSERGGRGVVTILFHRLPINNYIVSIIIPINHFTAISQSTLLCRLLVLGSV